MPGNHADPAMAEVEEMRDREVGGLAVVEREGVDAEAGRGIVDADEPHPPARQPAVAIVVLAAGRTEDGPGRLVRAHQREQLGLALGVMVADPEQHRIAGAVRLALDALDQLGEERIGDVGDDQADQRGRSPLQAARHGVALVAEPGHGVR